MINKKKNYISNYTYLLIILLLFISSKYSYATFYNRFELLDEGRRFTNTLNNYYLLSDSVNPSGVEIGAVMYPGFSVDTNQGTNNVLVTLGSFTGKFNLSEMFTLYSIVNIYDIRSSNREEMHVIDVGGGTLWPSRDDDGDINYSKVKYGLLAEVLLGLDIRFADIVRVNISGIYAYEELNNTIYDTRVINGITQVGGINVDEDGDFLYIEYTERHKSSFYPVFGLYLFESLSTLLTYSPGDRDVSATTTNFNYEIGETAGTVHFTYTLYGYWRSDHGIMVGMNKLLGFFAFGSEYLARRNMFNNFYLGIDYDLFSSGSSSLQIKLYLNMARTPETIVIRESEDFIFGGLFRMDLYLGNTDDDLIRSYHLFFSIEHNYYDSLKIFRGAVDKWGIGFGIGARLNLCGDSTQDEGESIHDGDIDLENSISKPDAI